MLRNVYGLDLGTYEIKVYDKKRDRIWKEKNVMAIEDGEKVLAFGNKAYEMYEKSPDNIEIVFPMKEGEISHFHNMQYLLTNLLKNGKRRSANYVVAVPTNVTAVQKRAFYDLVVHSSARAKEVNVVERGVADAVGLSLIHILHWTFSGNWGFSQKSAMDIIIPNLIKLRLFRRCCEWNWNDFMCRSVAIQRWFLL